MLAKIIMIAGVLGIGGYVARTASKHDTAVYPYSADEVRSMLETSRTTLGARSGGSGTQIWGAGRSANGVRLNMKHSSKGKLLECEAVIEAIAPDESRVVPVCRSGPESTSALGRVNEALNDPSFAEHIDATLDKRAFDEKAVARRGGAIVLKNLGGIQKEGMRMAVEDARMRTTENR